MGNKKALKELNKFLKTYCHDLSEDERKEGEIANCKKCGFETKNGECLIRSFIVKNRKSEEPETDILRLEQGDYEKLMTGQDLYISVCTKDGNIFSHGVKIRAVDSRLLGVRSRKDG